MPRLSSVFFLPAVVAFALAAETRTGKPAVQAPPPPSPGCSTPAHRALDFWVGEWTAATPDGSSAGTSRIERSFGGCVIVEHYTGSGGYEGMSINTLDPASRQWTQHWVDNSGMSVEMKGEFEGKNLVYHRAFTRRDGVPVRSRMTFFDLGGKVRQLVEQSADEGKSWKTQIDLLYTRR